MSPEWTLISVNAVFLGMAYLWVYPGLPQKTWRSLIRYDLAISAAALTVAALLYAGNGIAFNALLFDLPWWAFSLLSFAAMELPVWEWFRRKHGIHYDDLQ